MSPLKQLRHTLTTLGRVGQYVRNYYSPFVKLVNLLQNSLCGFLGMFTTFVVPQVKQVRLGKPNGR